MIAAERMRLTRTRRRRCDELRVMLLEISDGKVAILVVRGFIGATQRDSPIAIAHSVGEMVDALPPERWPAAQQR